MRLIFAFCGLCQDRLFIRGFKDCLDLIFDLVQWFHLWLLRWVLLLLFDLSVLQRMDFLVSFIFRPVGKLVEAVDLFACPSIISQQ